MITEKFPQLATLTDEEKLLLAEELWESVAGDSSHIKLTDAQKTLLDRRWKEYEANPDSASSWEEVKRRVFNR